MALQVWLPLTKDLRNQGLNNMTVTSHNATLNTAGKLGSCYYFNGNQQWLQLSDNLGNFYNDNWSVACWLKPTDSTRSVIISEYNTSGASNVGLELTTSRIVRLYWNGSPDINFTTAGALPLNEWTHLTVTKAGRVVKVYFNGELKQTYTNSSDFSTRTSAAQPRIGDDYRGNSANTVSYQGYINDFRMYDHCLSPMEVKQLSQGLVLHYPLNRQGFGQDNLMPNSVEMPVGSANPSTGTWRLAGDSRMTRSRVAIPDAPSGTSTYGFQSVGLQTGQDASCWGIDSFPKENEVTYTLSAWGRIVGGSTTAAMLGFSVYNGTTLDYGGTYGQAKSSDAEYYGSGAYDYAGGKLNPNGNWTRIYRTFTSTATSGNIYIGFNTAKTGSNVTLQLCGVKLEKGDKMTPWIPNSNESMYTILGLNGTTEYDCSGYCNNSVYNSRPTVSSDTSKYNVSTYFGAYNTPKTDLIDTSLLATLTNCSIAWWAKTDVVKTLFFTGQDGSHYVMASNNNNFYHQNAGSPTIYRDGIAGTYKNEAGVWHHYVMTGVNISSWTQFRINSYSSWPLNGLMTDVRIYATALSASDVKSLYQNCATIDPDGTIHGQIR